MKRILHQFLCGSKTDLMSNVCKRHPHMGQETHKWVKRLTCKKRDPRTKTVLFNCPMCVKSDSHSRKKTLICERRTTYWKRGPHVEKETHVQKLRPPTQDILDSWTFETAFFFSPKTSFLAIDVFYYTWMKCHVHTHKTRCIDTQLYVVHDRRFLHPTNMYTHEYD